MGVNVEALPRELQDAMPMKSNVEVLAQDCDSDCVSTCTNCNVSPVIFEAENNK